MHEAWHNPDVRQLHNARASVRRAESGLLSRAFRFSPSLTRTVEAKYAEQGAEPDEEAILGRAALLDKLIARTEVAENRTTRPIDEPQGVAEARSLRDALNRPSSTERLKAARPSSRLKRRCNWRPTSD